MASIFEKTMQACRESKANAAKKSNATSKKLTEKFASKRIKKESEDEEDFDDEVMMDVQDDIVAVIDPDIDADEMTSVALGFQQLVDDATANEIPETDEYIDQEIYGCPICGAKFFSEEPLIGPGKCPVCDQEADGFVLVGEVDESEGKEDSEDKSDETSDKTSDADDKSEGGEEDFDIEITTDEKKKPVKGERKIRRAVRSERNVPCGTSRRAMRRESVARRGSRLNLDESTFNGPLTKFVRENYENARSMRVVNAKLKGNNLTLECVATFKSGKKSRISLEGKYDRKSKIMLAKDNGAFKAESKKAPFMFKINTRAGVIRCEGMKYNFTTTTKIENESKKVRVHGTCMTESRRVARRPMTRRAMESRRISARKPMVRRETESRRAIRRPIVRRTTESRRIARRPVAPRVAESRRVVRKPMTRRTESTRIARRVRPSVRAAESRRVVRRANRTVEARKATRRSVRPMRAESTRVRRPVTRRSSLRTESRIARRDAIARRTRR